jgi:ubiquinone/menaquinone biosynthesis C-methylase UbiE
MDDFTDMFSDRAREYAQFRPTYPDELFDYVASVAPSRGLVWDCATGNGQAAVELAERFDRVIATDANEAQLEHAVEHPRVEYRRALAESSGIDSGSVDAVTVATAIHWFDLDAFVAEARRTLVAGGILAFWTYSWSETVPAVKDVASRYALEIVGDYWADEVKQAWNGYADLEIDLPELEAPRFEARAERTADELLGYLCTWSASQRWARDHGSDPTELIADDVRAAFGDNERIEIRWPLALRVFRNE